MDPTNRSIPQTKTHTILQSLHVLSNTYYHRMEPNCYVYQPNIRILMVITKKIIYYLQERLWSNNGPDQQEYQPNQDPHHATKYTSLSNRSIEKLSTSQKQLESKSHLVLAITFEILALYRSLFKILGN
jgi:hypothetical protein